MFLWVWRAWWMVCKRLCSSSWKLASAPCPVSCGGAGRVQASSAGLPGLLSLLSSAYIPGTGTGLPGNKMLWHPSKPLT